MKVAIAKEGDRVSEHFGHCTEYALFVIEKSEIASREILAAPGTTGKLPPFLASHKVTHVLAGGMGPRAVDLFCENNIEVFLGVRGSDRDRYQGLHGRKDCTGWRTSLYPRARSRMQWALILSYHVRSPEEMVITTRFSEMRDRTYKNCVECHYEKYQGIPELLEAYMEENAADERWITAHELRG